jgi:hypothetical protein
MIHKSIATKKTQHLTRIGESPLTFRKFTSPIEGLPSKRDYIGILCDMSYFTVLVYTSHFKGVVVCRRDSQWSEPLTN